MSPISASGAPTSVSRRPERGSKSTRTTLSLRASSNTREILPGSGVRGSARTMRGLSSLDDRSRMHIEDWPNPVPVVPQV
jgi:hypothetical protein